MNVEYFEERFFERIKKRNSQFIYSSYHKHPPNLMGVHVLNIPSFFPNIEALPYLLENFDGVPTKPLLRISYHHISKN